MPPDPAPLMNLCYLQLLALIQTESITLWLYQLVPNLPTLISLLSLSPVFTLVITNSQHHLSPPTLPYSLYLIFVSIYSKLLNL